MSESEGVGGFDAQGIVFLLDLTEEGGAVYGAGPTRLTISVQKYHDLGHRKWLMLQVCPHIPEEVAMRMRGQIE